MGFNGLPTWGKRDRVNLKNHKNRKNGGYTWINKRGKINKITRVCRTSLASGVVYHKGDTCDELQNLRRVGTPCAGLGSLLHKV